MPASMRTTRKPLRQPLPVVLGLALIVALAAGLACRPDPAPANLPGPAPNTAAGAASQSAPTPNPRSDPAARATDPSTIAPAAGRPQELPGLHNFFWLSKRWSTGGEPQGARGFKSLAEAGVRTILSVDGAAPDVATAKQYGLRYVHLPIGYDGITRSAALSIVKACQTLPGPLYIHCFHGKHRGPAAAALVRRALDRIPAAQALAEMRRSGTSPHYAGLYAAVERFAVPQPEELARLPADFPQAIRPEGLQAWMVSISRTWERVKNSEKNGWRADPRTPDIDPAREGSQLVKQLRELTRTGLPGIPAEPAYRALLARASEAAENLEAALRRAPVAKAEIERRARALKTTCTRCHDRYRD